MKVELAKNRKDIEFCKKALLEFRPNVNSETCVEQVLRMMEQGFQLAYIADEDNSQATAIAGFRIYEKLLTDNHIYIDDLFTFPENRGKGHAGALLEYIHNIARTSGIKTVHLDSGFALHPAHRLYVKNGYVLACHHFAKIIG